MGISTQQYIIKIGINYWISVKNIRKPKSSSVVPKSTKTNTLNLKLLILLAIVLLFPHPSLSQSRNKRTSSRRIYTPDPTYNSTKINPILPFLQQNLNQPCCMRWNITGLSTNKLQSMINGNRRSLGYKLVVWNCGGGLLGSVGPTNKLEDIKEFIKNKKLHALGIVETDLFSPESNSRKTSKFYSDTVRSLLHVPGYSLEFPSTWHYHGHARIIVCISNDIKACRKTCLALLWRLE